MITIITVGKKHEDWVNAGIERYQRRLRPPYSVDWILLAHSSLENMRARQEESERILNRLGTGDYVILLDETGKMIDSPELASLLDEQHVHSKSVTVIIGGAYGVDERVMQRADVKLSLSRLVFPHQLVRLLLIEQLYRAQDITAGGKYHHI